MDGKNLSSFQKLCELQSQVGKEHFDCLYISCNASRLPTVQTDNLHRWLLSWNNSPPPIKMPYGIWAKGLFLWNHWRTLTRYQSGHWGSLRFGSLNSQNLTETISKTQCGVAQLPYPIYSQRKAYLSKQWLWRAAADSHLACGRSWVRAPAPAGMLHMLFPPLPSFLWEISHLPRILCEALRTANPMVW